MANYYAATRSNYFRVKDAAGFEKMCGDLHLEFWTKTFAEHPGDTFYAISADTGDCGGWPSSRLDEATDEYADTDIESELSEHLDPRDVAILLETGSEKLRYLVGHAVAVHATKPSVYVTISSIIDLARQAFGPEAVITEAQY
jgi:hypothetical protein